jgi:hypothetical protein
MLSRINVIRSAAKITETGRELNDEDIQAEPGLRPAQRVNNPLGCIRAGPPRLF